MSWRSVKGSARDAMAMPRQYHGMSRKKGKTVRGSLTDELPNVVGVLYHLRFQLQYF